jgi:hypothetical protein
MKRIITLGLLIVLLLPQIAMAATNDTEFKIPSFSSAWAKLPDTLKEPILLVIALLVVALVVSGVGSTIISGVLAVFSGKKGDAHGRSSNLTDMLLAPAMIIFALLAIAAILWWVG